MCVGPEQSNSSPKAVSQLDASGPNNNDAESSNSDGVDIISYLLELAANNDITNFKETIENHKTNVLGVGNWYSRRNGSKLMVLEQRTPSMIAALYGSTDVLKYILSLYDSFEDINMACGTDGSTALHCAAAGGSPNAVETVNLLLDFGADINVLDAQGRRPADVIASFPRLKNVKKTLEYLLVAGKCIVDMQIDVPKVISLSGCPSGDESSHSEDVVDVKDFSIPALSNSSSEVSPSSSPRAGLLDKASVEGNEKVREYPVDPSIPDIKNSIYTTDEFRMYSFKIRPCSRAYSHDWTECPFVHPGENARRRDPRRYHYSCVPCPDFRKGQCRRGDACEYAHGVFECWLHPAQYRTRLCKDGTDCTRRVCFFAHTADELRPLYMSSGSTIPSPRASLDMAAMSPPLAPGSPSSNIMMSSFSLSNSGHNPTQVNVGTPPLSPSSAGAWSSSSVPALHLPGMNLQTSRLRSSLSARDIPLDDLGRMSEYDNQHVTEFSPLPSQTLSTQARLNAAVAASACGSVSSRSGKYRSLGLNVAPTNLEELFASEISSPRSMMHDPVLMSPVDTHMKSSQVQSQVNSQKFSPIPDQMQLQLQQAALESQLQGSPRLYTSPQTQPIQGSPRVYSSPSTPSYSLGSLGRMSTLGPLEIERQSSEISLPPAVMAARAAFAQHDKRSHSSRDLGAGSTWSDWGSPNGKAEWSIQRDDLSRFRKSASFGFRGSDEPDLTWVQTLVKEGPQDVDVTPMLSSEDGSGGDPRDASDCSALGSWMENLHLDQIVA